MAIIDKAEWGTIFSYLVWALVTGLMTNVFPLLVGFGPQLGFSEVGIFDKFSFYNTIGIVGIVLTALVVAIGVILFKSSDKVKNPVIVHNPDKGIVSLSLFWLFFGSLILFGLFGILNVSSQQSFFSDVPSLQQQATETGRVFFAAFPAAPAEDSVLFLLLNVVALVITRAFYKRINLSGVAAKVANTAIFFFIGGFYGLIIHFLRYGSSESSLFYVFIFWALSGTLVGIFGSVIPSMVLHITWNLFLEIKNVFSSQLALGVAIGVWLLLIFLVVGFWLLSRAVKSRFVSGRKVIAS